MDSYLDSTAYPTSQVISNHIPICLDTKIFNWGVQNISILRTFGSATVSMNCWPFIQIPNIKNPITTLNNNNNNNLI